MWWRRRSLSPGRRTGLFGKLRLLLEIEVEASLLRHIWSIFTIRGERRGEFGEVRGGHCSHGGIVLRLRWWVPEHKYSGRKSSSIIQISTETLRSARATFPGALHHINTLASSGDPAGCITKCLSHEPLRPGRCPICVL